jgi:hypothetical protein
VTQKVTLRPFGPLRDVEIDVKDFMVFIGPQASGKSTLSYIREGSRCDYLVVDCEEERAYFVELKGSDFLHAIKQIDATIDRLQADLSGFSIFARVVATKISVPNLQNNPQVLKMRRRLKSRGGNLDYRTRSIEETI